MLTRTNIAQCKIFLSGEHWQSPWFSWSRFNSPPKGRQSENRLLPMSVAYMGLPHAKKSFSAFDQRVGSYSWHCQQTM